MLSPTDGDRANPSLDDTVVLGFRTGSDAMKPADGGGGGQLTHGVSEQAPNQTTKPSAATINTLLPYRLMAWEPRSR